MPRHIFIGDIHGCLDELRQLLDLIRVEPADIVVALGDLVRKGPSPAGCLDLWRERGYLAVLGNNEQKILDRAKWPILRFFAPRPDRDVLRRRDLLESIQRWPHMLDFPEAGVVAVHGGVLPNSRTFSADLAPRDVALKLRRIARGPNREWIPSAKGRFWAEVWEGDRTVVYGHTPRKEIRVDARAIGLDTGCVYGGALSAFIVEKDGSRRFESVPARRAWSR